MLKRTTGRLLLSLLVITGLAGTINNNSLSKSERKYAIGLMKDTYKETLQNIKGLSEGQLNYKASPEKWSVKECFYHIVAAEKGLWSMLEGVMKSPVNPEKRAEIKLTDQEFVSMIQDRSKKAQAVDPLQPRNIKYQSIDEAIADFKTIRTDHIKYMKTSTEDMRNHVVTLPFGSIDCYQLYLMLAAHSNRHSQQMTEVKNSPGYPAK